MDQAGVARRIAIAGLLALAGLRPGFASESEDLVRALGLAPGMTVADVVVFGRGEG